MNLHFLPDSPYSLKFIEYVNQMTKSNNQFVVIKKSDTQYVKSNDNVHQIKNKSIVGLVLSIIHEIRKNKPDKLFLHFLSDVHLAPVFFVNKKTIIYWMVWGGDIYSFIPFNLYDSETMNAINIHEKNVNVITLLFRMIRKVAIRRINYIAINNTEFSIIKKYFITDAERVNFKYPNSIEPILSVSDNDQKKTCKVILLGNSGDPSNNHITIIKKLKNITLDFKVLVPLSYGSNRQYIDKVIEIGNKQLGNKFIAITEFMDAVEYGKLLDTVDVAIMNHTRQQGAGNLRILLSFGKKVYLNSCSPLYEYYSSEGVVLSRIDKDTFNNSIFDEYSLDIKERNKRAMDSIYSEENVHKYIKDLCM